MRKCKRTDKTCEGCGAWMIDVPANRRFCDVCRKVRHAESNTQWSARQDLAAGRTPKPREGRHAAAPKPREGRHAAAPKPPVAKALPLDYVAVQATNEGISYGGYSVKHRLYEKHI